MHEEQEKLMRMIDFKLAVKLLVAQKKLADSQAGIIVHGKDGIVTVLQLKD